MPRPLSFVQGKAAPLEADDVDTDQIIPAQFLKVTEKAGLHRYLFYRWRYDEAGNLTGKFVLDRQEFSGSRLLVAGRNFGIGSSRENAVWALLDWGIECVVARSFGDIFYNNAAKNGLVCVKLAEAELNGLRASAGSGNLSVSVDLADQTLTFDGRTLHFEIEEHVRERLMTGMDDIALTTSKYVSEIERYESSMPTFMKPRKS